MDQNNERTQRIIRISRTKFVFLIIGAIVLAAIIWAAVQVLTTSYRYDSPTIFAPMPQSGIMEINSISQDSISPEYYKGRYPNGTADITDTREFLKTTYSASIRTRYVQEVVTDVKNIVKGADGRIDSLNSSEKYGYVSFVVAKSKFDAFKSEIESLTNAKLYTESINSDNRLTTKQGIETDISSANTNLTQLKADLAALDKKHSQTLAPLNTELARIQRELAAVRTNIWNMTDETDEITLSAWKNQETAYINQEATQKQRIYSENSTYNTDKQRLDSRIASQTAYLASAQGRDVTFTNDIETVNGSVNVSWISIWQIIKIFSPISPIWIILILIIAIWSYLHHKKITPKLVIG